jgi:hypothetical protein
MEGRQCGLRRTEPRKEEAGGRREDPRDDDERKFGPYEGRIVNRDENAHCAILKGENEREEGILFCKVGGREMEGK